MLKLLQEVKHAALQTNQFPITKSDFFPQNFPLPVQGSFQWV